MRWRVLASNMQLLKGVENKQWRTERLCCSLCVMWISVFEPFDVIMSFPLCLPICFSSSLCFSVMSTFFLLNKGKHAIPHNGIFSSVMCPWMGWFSFAATRECSSVCVCVCVCVWGMRHSRGVKTWDGVRLVVLPELFSTWGNMRVNANPVYHRRPPEQTGLFFQERCVFFCYIFKQQ